MTNRAARTPRRRRSCPPRSAPRSRRSGPGRGDGDPPGVGPDRDGGAGRTSHDGGDRVRAAVGHVERRTARREGEGVRVRPDRDGGADRAPVIGVTEFEPPLATQTVEPFGETARASGSDPTAMAVPAEPPVIGVTVPEPPLATQTVEPFGETARASGSTRPRWRCGRAPRDRGDVPSRRWRPRPWNRPGRRRGRPGPTRPRWRRRPSPP